MVLVREESGEAAESGEVAESGEALVLLWA
jgi:hypothetical protein